MAAYESFAAVYDRLMDDVDYAAWSAYLIGLLEEAGGIASVVDCACGTGSIAIPLAQAGYAVTGLDRSEEMLMIAGEKARRAGFSRLPFIRQDMRALALHRPADAINCACDGVNYLAAPADVRAFFRAAHAALRPGGLLLFDISSAYKLEHVLGDRFFGEDRGDCAYLWQNAYDPERRLLELRLTIFREKAGLYERFFERHVQRAHTEAEIRAWLAEAGFSEIKAYEAFTREPPGAEAERVQFAARRD